MNAAAQEGYTALNNYIYFGFCFFVLALLSTLHLFYLDQAPLGTRLFFFAYGIGQAILEVGAFFLLSKFLPRSGWFFFRSTAGPLL